MNLKTFHLTRRKARGFTLIELMIVVVIVAILASIALPSYQEQVRKSRRADAKAALMELSGFMERFYAANGRYDQDGGGNAVTLPFDESPKDGSSRKYYDLSLPAADLDTDEYELQAAAKNGQEADKVGGTSCATLTLDHLGVKSPPDCW